MPFQVVGEPRANPTIDVMVGEAATGLPRRLILLSGVVDVRPDPEGVPSYDAEPVGFYVPGCRALPPDDQVSIGGEASLAKFPVEAGGSAEALIGIDQVTATLYRDREHGDVQWPYLGFVCHGARPLAVRYRVTIFGGEDPRAIRPFG